MNFPNVYFVRLAFIDFPYGEAKVYLNKAVFSSSISFPRKVSYFVVGAFLLLPIVNVIILIARDYFLQKDEELYKQEPLKTSPLNGRIIAFKQYEDDYKNIEELSNQGRIEDAWSLYEQVCDKEIESLFQNHDRPIKSWARLPSQTLINKLIEKLPSSDAILSTIYMDLIRDCALAYEDFCGKCFQEDKLWNCFNGYPEYIADISNKYPSFAFKVITSARGTILVTDEYRFEIFRAAYPQILTAIQQNLFNDEQMQYLVAFLLCYRSVISQEDFEKIQEIKKRLEKKSEGSEDITILMDLLIGKLLLQGIYKEGEKLITSFNFENFIRLFHLSRADVDEQEIYERIAELDSSGDFQKGVILISFIPKKAPSYFQARMVLGRAWMDSEEFNEAGKCFLQAADSKTMRHEALLLAATCLLAKPANSQEYISRQKTKKTNTSIGLLSLKDCQELLSNKAAFFSILGDLYKDEPDFSLLLSPERFSTD